MVVHRSAPRRPYHRGGVQIPDPDAVEGLTKDVDANGDGLANFEE